MSQEKNNQNEEKKDIIINMEREIQDQEVKLQKQYGLKINTLQNLNIQLNGKLQQYEETQNNFENLREEYENSLSLINEQGEKIAELDAQKRELENNYSELKLQRDHQESTAKRLQEETQAQLREMEQKYESKVAILKQNHQKQTIGIMNSNIYSPN